ncbi:nitroreductase family protein [Larsenimonas rhizosphaerae]|uniref:nitroreductase family protein n=1 Tax=Larsenimonas rhizosphaerae TaxID=2944682 RepID=UPI0020332245|nr:nitroreductase family protein [Larsenimonas rhizosphaerae]MCM2132027.1 nitroreductase family protein [Larsenimonas rhizosphaerae]
MDALTLLSARRSVSRLEGPEPSESQCRTLYCAALRAPDHGALRPWHFIEIKGEGACGRLGDLFADAEQHDTPDATPRRLEGTRAKALRAPLIVVVVARVQPGQPKIPDQEQVISAGCAAHAMLYAAHAQGLGAIWRTGPMAAHPVVRRGLGVREHDVIVGFLYIGHPAGPIKPVDDPDPMDFVERWPG